MFQKILVPLDGSPEAEVALDYACQLAQAFGGELLLLRVAPHPTLPPPRYSATDAEVWQITQAQQKQEAEAYLAEVARRPAITAVPHRRIIGEGVVTEMILQVAEEQNVDVIIMLKRRRGRLARWVLGNKATEVVQQAPMPVLLVKTDQAKLAD